MTKPIQERLKSADSYVSLALGLAVILMLGVLVYNYSKNKTTAPGSSGSEETQTPPTPIPGGTHIVTDGETLWRIAEKYYKSGYNWVDIQTANALPNPDLIEVGQNLVIPTAIPIMPQGDIASGLMTESTQTTPSTETVRRTYTVVTGDYLSKISFTQYGNAYRWPEIASLNKIENPDLIYAGTVLTLP